MTKIVPTPDWWYHDSSLELGDDYCHHNNLYEDCELCAIEEGEMDPQDATGEDDVGWKLSPLPHL